MADLPTTVARYLLKELSSEEHEQLVQWLRADEANRRAFLAEVDFYRVTRPEEAYELGIEDAFHEGISLIEWPDRIRGLLPRERLDLQLIARGKKARRAVLRGTGSWMERLRDSGHA